MVHCNLKYSERNLFVVYVSGRRRDPSARRRRLVPASRPLPFRRCALGRLHVGRERAAVWRCHETGRGGPSPGCCPDVYRATAACHSVMSAPLFVTKYNCRRRCRYCFDPLCECCEERIRWLPPQNSRLLGPFRGTYTSLCENILCVPSAVKKLSAPQS